MTEHNDMQATPELLEPRKLGKLLRLGASCPVLLMLTALLLVGGSFSKNTSEGEISVSTDLTAALFDVIVEESGEYTSGDQYDSDTYHTVIDSFTVINNSDVDVIYTMKFDIGINFDKNSEYLTGLKVFLDEDSDTIINSNEDYPDMDVSKGIFFTTEEFYLTAGDSNTYNLVADSNDCTGPHSITGDISGTITITAKQAEGTY